MKVSGADIREVRKALGESQTTFGERFRVTKRTIIRWEKDGRYMSHWDGDYRAWYSACQAAGLDQRRLAFFDGDTCQAGVTKGGKGDS